MTIGTLGTGRKQHLIFFALIVGLGAVMAFATESFAKPKQPIYNQCACRCVAPGDIVGSISHFNNNAGVSCGVYLGKTCNYTNSQTGGVSTGTLKNCGGYKPGGTQALQQTVPQVNAPIMRRGVEDEQPEPSTTAPKEKGQ
ncbi:MAG: hypothetical protein Q7U39_17955 [Nitrospira sp.]|nr:hypothetical protein [Nitrospira sp.]